MNKIIKVGVFAIIIGAILFGVSLKVTKDNTEEQLFGADLLEKTDLTKIELPSNVKFASLTKENKIVLINNIKSKTLKNGKIIPNSLTEEENNVLMEIIKDRYEGVQIKDLPKEAFEVTNGKLKLKLEYLINNL